MIVIAETKRPRKVSGRTSFLVTFPYDPKITEAMKALPLAAWLRADQAWEIPADSLAQALDSLTFLSDIKLSLLREGEAEVGLPPLTEAEIFALKGGPLPHQIEAIDYGLARPTGKWLLLDGMGVGKSAESIWYAETLKRRGLISHCLVICGVDSLRSNWKREISKFSNEGVLVLGEKVSKKGKVSYASVAERAKRLKGKIDEFFVVANIASVRSDAFVDAFKGSENEFGLIIVDEAHKVSNKSSQQGSNLLKLKAPFEVAMTGTLLTNSPLSAYLPLSWTGNDASTLTNFKSQYCEFGGFKNSQVIGYKNLESLRDELDSCSLRRTLDQVRDSMPPKTVVEELVDMPDDHRKFYEAIANGVKEEADKIELKASNLLALTTRLRQATSCPSVLTSQPVRSCKIERAAELAEELMSHGEKVVIMATFKESVAELAEMLKAYSPLLGTGDIPDPQVSANIERFQSDPSAKLFICTHSKCGTGVTLNAAMYCVMVDTPWTHASFAQSCDRIWRINNSRPACITVLSCQGTIDERVRAIVERKKELGDYLVDGASNALADSLKDDMLDIIRNL